VSHEVQKKGGKGTLGRYGGGGPFSAPRGGREGAKESIRKRGRKKKSKGGILHLKLRPRGIGVQRGKGETANDSEFCFKRLLGRSSSVKGIFPASSRDRGNLPKGKI